MKGKLLITGASGFLGFHLVEQALLQDYEVFAGIRKSSNAGHLSGTAAKLLQLDLSNTASLTASLQDNGITHIIHAAALTKAKTEADYNFSNAELTRNLAIAAAGMQPAIKKFVFISSLAAMGPSANGSPISEDDPPQPLTWYGKSKLLAEKYLLDVPNLPFIALRPTAVYGPREKELFLLVQSVKRGLEVYIGNTEQRLSFVYVKDLAALAIDCLSAEINREFYNISDGKVYSRYAFADAAKKATGKKTLKLQFPLAVIKAVAAGMDALYSRSARTPVLNKEKVKELTAADWSVNIDKSRRDLRFQPVYDLESGMEESVQWYRQNKWI